MKNIWKPILLFILLFAVSCGKGKESETSTGATGKQEEDNSLVKLSLEAQKLAEIEIEPVNLRPIVGELELPGTIQANENSFTHVGSRIPGRVVRVDAKLGDQVKRGQQLAVIDSVELGKAESEYLTAKAKLLVAEKAYERAKTLLEGKVIGTGEFQRREGDYLSTKAEAEAAENQLHLFGLNEQQVDSLKSDDSLRSQVPIFSPLNGTIIERHITMGELVEPSTQLYAIADLSTVWGIADVPEQTIARVKRGSSAEVRVAAYPSESFKGTISYVSDVLDASSRTIKARVEIDNTDGRLKPQMFATFRIVGDDSRKALAVPESSIQQDGNQTVVFVAQEGGFEKRSVELGQESKGFHEVLAGLNVGEKVVTRGAFVLKSEAGKEQMEEE